MKPTRSYLDDVAERLRQRGGIEVHIQDGGGVEMAQLEWREGRRLPQVWWSLDFVDTLESPEFEAVCAHEYRHALGWRVGQERFFYRDAHGNPRPFIGSSRFVFMHWFFEFRSDAYAADFTGTASALSMLGKVEAWAKSHRAPPEMHRLQPHPPYERRVRFLARRAGAP